MSTIDLTMRDSVAVLRLANGVTNAIGTALVTDLTSALEVVKSDARGLVLAGNEKFFSIGFNLPELVTFDRPRMTDFFQRFDRFAFELYRLPIPTACAMTGHAVAGGTVLALCCDDRYAAEGKKLLGLNESTIGLPVPYLPDLILRQILPDGKANEMVFDGQFMQSSQACEIGLVDAILPSDEVENRAIAQVRALTNISRKSFCVLKENRIEAVCERYERNNADKLTRMLDCWFDKNTQELLRDAALKF